MKQHSIFIGLSLLAFASSAFADDDSFTQMKTWECVVQPGPPFGPVPCNIPFPQSFGDVPQLLVFSDNGTFGNRLSVPIMGNSDRPWSKINPVKLTREGFTLEAMPSLHGSARYTGTWIAVGTRLAVGTVTAKYLVLSVMYAPPADAKGNNVVKYADKSTTGVTVTASRSFKTTNSLSAKVNVDLKLFGKDSYGGDWESSHMKLTLSQCNYRNQLNHP